eukprot:UN02907
MVNTTRVTVDTETQIPKYEPISSIVLLSSQLQSILLSTLNITTYTPEQYYHIEFITLRTSDVDFFNNPTNQQQHQQQQQQQQQGADIQDLNIGYNGIVEVHCVLESSWGTQSGVYSHADIYQPITSNQNIQKPWPNSLFLSWRRVADHMKDNGIFNDYNVNDNVNVNDATQQPSAVSDRI